MQFAAQVCTRWPELGNKEIRKDIEKNVRHKHSSPARVGGGGALIRARAAAGLGQSGEAT
jgi:hypothetical protein